MANADHYRRCYLSAQTMPPFTLVMKADSDSARQRSSFFLVSVLLTAFFRITYPPAIHSFSFLFFSFLMTPYGHGYFKPGSVWA